MMSLLVIIQIFLPMFNIFFCFSKLMKLMHLFNLICTFRFLNNFMFLFDVYFSPIHVFEMTPAFDSRTNFMQWMYLIALFKICIRFNFLLFVSFGCIGKTLNNF